MQRNRSWRAFAFALLVMLGAAIAIARVASSVMAYAQLSVVDTTVVAAHFAKRSACGDAFAMPTELSHHSDMSRSTAA